MTSTLLHKIKSSIAKSDSAARKHWAEQIVDSQLPLAHFVPILFVEPKTAQRFMWTIGDVCELDPDVVAQCMPMLFDMRNQMPFLGMDRSVAKWLWLTSVPASVEPQAIPQLLDWLTNDTASIASKSYSAKALFDLVKNSRLEKKKLDTALRAQALHKNKAYASRIKKLLRELRSLSTA
jgi:hypothetical protein